MKKALATILVFIALTNIVGFMPLYFSLLQEIKSEVNLRLAKENDLQKLQVSEAEYNDPAVFGITESNEFRFRGHMYDYKTATKTQEGYTFFVLEDKRESNLVDFLKSTFGPGNDNAKSSKLPFADLIKNFSKDFVGSCSHTLFFPLTTQGSLAFYLTQKTCNGFNMPVQNPPDLKC